MARHGELPERLGRPVWSKPIGGLLATTLGTVLLACAVIDIPRQLGVLGGLLAVAFVGETVIRVRGRRRTKPPQLRGFRA